MVGEEFSGRFPLVVGVLPDQHVEVLQTARALAEQLGVPLVCAYVDEASYLVEWDPSRETHRMSLHPEKDDEDVAAIRNDLGKEIAEAIIVGSYMFIRDRSGVVWAAEKAAGSRAGKIKRKY